jgi:3-oxoadipate enol-lactonase
VKAQPTEHAAALIPRTATRPALSYLDTGEVEDTGDPDHRGSVVLLHSIGTDGRLWHQQLRTLSARYRVLVPDARGHGGSGWIDGAELTIEDWVEDITTVLDDAGVRAATLVGLSMGGVQALAYALAHPERVVGLVLADTFAELDAEVADAKVKSLISQANGGMESFADNYLDQTLTDGHVDDAALRAVLRDAIANVPAGAYSASSRACFGVRLGDRLPEVRTPTLVLWGSLDSKTPRALSQELVAGIPNSRYAEVPAAGHLSAVENPEAFADALTSFLDSLHDDTRTGRTDSWR